MPLGARTILDMMESGEYNLLRNRVGSVLLISFCNLPQPQRSGALLYDSYGSATRWIDVGAMGLVSGSTGLSQNRSHVFLLSHVEGKDVLSMLEKATLKPVLSQELHEVRDAHSLCVTDTHIFVVSTGTDEVVRYDLNTNGCSQPNVIWQATNKKCDTHHLNSIVLHRDELIVAGLGPKPAELWSSATKGYIFNISQNRLIKEGIYHPHSLCVLNDDVYYCESVTQTWCSLDGTVHCSVNGYARGVCFVDQHTVVIGTSLGRQVSKSTRILNNPADHGELAGECGLTVYHRDTNQHESISLSQFGTEIYDICHFSPEYMKES